MDLDLPDAEREFVDRARSRILDHSRQRREAGLVDRIHAVARSATGELYEGMAFETSQPQFDCCAERHAIADMHYAETERATLDALLVAGPVPDAEADPVTPCGACRHAIHEFGENPTVYCATFVREPEEWTAFPTVERYTAEQLYPARRPHPEWDDADG